MIKPAFAETVTQATEVVAVADTAATKGGMSQATSFYIKMLLLLVIFYIFLIRPSQKRAKAHAELLAGVKPGDSVIVAGSIVGKVTKDLGTEVMVNIAKDVEIKVLKAKITEVLSEPKANDNKEGTHKK